MKESVGDPSGRTPQMHEILPNDGKTRWLSRWRLVASVIGGIFAVAGMVVYFTFIHVPNGLEMSIQQTAWSLWLRNESASAWPAGTKIQLETVGRKELFEVTLSNPLPLRDMNEPSGLSFFTVIRYDCFSGEYSKKPLADFLSLTNSPEKCNIQVKSVSVSIPGVGVRRVLDPVVPDDRTSLGSVLASP